MDMLPPHPKNVAPALACVEPEGERQSSLRANTVHGLISGDVLFTPGVNAVAFRGLEFDALCRIDFTQIGRYGVLHQMTDRTQPVSRDARL